MMRKWVFYQIKGDFFLRVRFEEEKPTTVMFLAVEEWIMGFGKVIKSKTFYILASYIWN